MRHDDSFFAYICALDDQDDPFADEKCWPKANPSLGVTIRHKYLRDQVTQAKGMPAKESVVKRLNFCMWTEAASPWIGYDVWVDAADEYGPADLLNRPCVAALDMASTTDLTALVLAFAPTEADPYTRLLPFFWLPAIGLSEKSDKDVQPYTKWAHDGWLETTPGEAISSRFVLQRIAELSHTFDIRKIAYDRWGIKALKELADDEGYRIPELVPHGQGFEGMKLPVNQFEELLLNRKIKHNGNPVMTMCAANAVVISDAAGNRKPAKDKATGRIDGMVALVMSRGSGGREEEQPKPSIYETRGIITIG
jgi:phage terminase large subunit-like protein